MNKRKRESPSKNRNVRVRRELPWEIWAHIASFFPQTYLRSFTLVCKIWHAACPPLDKESVLPYNIPIGYAKWLMQNGGHISLGAAALSGDIRLMTWLLEENNQPLSSLAFGCAGKGGNIKAMEWLKAKRCPWGKETFYETALGGDTDALKWLHDNRCPRDHKYMEAIAKSGNTETMKWALKIIGKPDYAGPLRCATSRGDIEMMKLLVEFKLYYEWMVWESAAESGNLVAMELLKEHGFLRINGNTPICTAAESGSIENVKWFKENGWRLTHSVFWHAARGGNMEMLKWLKDNGCPCNTALCGAAIFGHIGNMEWLLENECLLDEWTFTMATKNGHLEVMKWLKEKGCPYNKDAFTAAAINKHAEAIRWLKKIGCPYDKKTTLAIGQMYMDHEGPVFTL